MKSVPLTSFHHLEVSGIGTPVHISNGQLLLWNHRTFRHGIAPENSSAPGKIVKAIGSVQFFRDGKLTVETVRALSPQLIALVGGLKSTESILSAHCARLKDRAKKNAINETVPQIQDALQRLRLDKEQSLICNVDMAILFWKHLAGALNITYIFEHPDSCAGKWAKAAFLYLVELVKSGEATSWSYSAWVDIAIASGIIQPDLMDVPLAPAFGCNPRLKQQAMNNILRQSQLDKTFDTILYVEHLPQSPINPAAPSLTLTTSPTSDNSSPIGLKLKAARSIAGMTSPLFPPTKRRCE